MTLCPYVSYMICLLVNPADKVHSRLLTATMAGRHQQCPLSPMDWEGSTQADAKPNQARQEAEEVLQLILDDVKNRCNHAHNPKQAAIDVEEQTMSILREHTAGIHREQLAKTSGTALQLPAKQGGPAVAHQGGSPAAAFLPFPHSSISKPPTAASMPPVRPKGSPAAVFLPSIHTGASEYSAAAPARYVHEGESPAAALPPFTHQRGRLVSYSDQAQRDHYAPGITWEIYNRHRSEDCGVVKDPPTANYIVKPPPQFESVNGRPFLCVICSSGFTRRLHVKDHFKYCVARNGNPQGYYWFDSPSILASYGPAGKELVTMSTRRINSEYQEQSKGKLVQGAANERVLPKCYVPEDEWPAYQEWRKSLGETKL